MHAVDEIILYTVPFISGSGRHFFKSALPCLLYTSISENMLRRYSARYGSIDSMIAGTPEVGLQLNDGSLYKAKGLSLIHI